MPDVVTVEYAYSANHRPEQTNSVLGPLSRNVGWFDNQWYGFEKTLCPLPAKAVYDGSGNVTWAASFVCV